jgi:predicted MFS family arabinose efflux permease
MGYKWIYTLLGFAAVPAALASSTLYRKIGPAMSCVLANLVTGGVTVALLYIATIPPASSSTFAVFVTILYAGFPITVVSQLTTGPMLDRIVPDHLRGLVQGLNITTLNFSFAVAPFLIGTMVDNRGIEVSLLLSVGISVAAALINTPLIFRKVMQAHQDEPML